MNILYQDKLLSHINRFTINTLPHTILLKGHQGSGKHLVCNYISDYFNLPLVDITEELNLEKITEIYLSPLPQMYLIDSDKISVKEQNIILKFLEEPSNLIFIVLLNSNNLLLDTIKNRCYNLDLQRYTKDNLKTFLTSDITDQSLLNLIIEISKTPGDVIKFSNVNFIDMYNFANKIFQYIKTANLSNCLTISNKLYFDNFIDNNYNVDLFCKVLLHISKSISPNIYILTNELNNALFIPHINKKLLFEKYIINLKYSI